MSRTAYWYTDAWHPTVNPSARMPIHHFRFTELFGTSNGTLNEFPRSWGGVTIRLIRFKNQHFTIHALPTTLRWPPWWLPACDRWATKAIENVYLTTLESNLLTSSERSLFDLVIETFRSECKVAGHTVGEAIYRVMDRLQQSVFGDIPSVGLNSLTKTRDRKVLVSALASLSNGINDCMAKWGAMRGVAMWPMIAVGVSDQGIPVRFRLHIQKRSLDMAPLTCDLTRPLRGPAIPISEQNLLQRIQDGLAIPSSYLISLAESQLDLQGCRVQHFGNTYGRLELARKLIGSKNQHAIACCRDNADSWCYAKLSRAATLETPYPLHLLDVATLPMPIRGRLSGLVHQSLARKEPVILSPLGDLSATLSN